MLLVHDEDRVPDSPTEGEVLLTESLGVNGLAAVDEAILQAAGPRWMKVARVVYDALKAGGFSTEDEYVRVHVRRIIALVKAAKLEAQGNLLRPRFSEVRLPAAGDAV
jgi:hypothetical protein